MNPKNNNTSKNKAVVASPRTLSENENRPLQGLPFASKTQRPTNRRFEGPTGRQDLRKNKQRVSPATTRAFPNRVRKSEVGLVFALRKSKKAQFYIFTAIMLIAYSTLLLQSGNVIPVTSKNLRMAYDNFAFESSKVINNALFEGEDVQEEYEIFVDNFISYSKMKKLNIEIFYMLETGERTYFSNNMKNDVHIININETVLKNTSTYFLRSNLSEAVIEVRDDVFHENIYKFETTEEGTDLKAVLRVRKGSKREIFVLE